MEWVLPDLHDPGFGFGWRSGLFMQCLKQPLRQPVSEFLTTRRGSCNYEHQRDSYNKVPVLRTRWCLRGFLGVTYVISYPDRKSVACGLSLAGALSCLSFRICRFSRGICEPVASSNRFCQQAFAGFGSVQTARDSTQVSKLVRYPATRLR